MANTNTVFFYNVFKMTRQMKEMNEEDHAAQRMFITYDGVGGRCRRINNIHKQLIGVYVLRTERAVSGAWH